jgi:hypothetical protein
MTVKRSIFQAMPLQSVLKWDGLFFPAADAIQGALGLIQVLEVVEVFKNGQAFFDGLWKSNGQHRNALYKYSAAGGEAG